MADPSAPPPNPQGLPPVVPPSGRMIAQLFVVPGLIVAGAVVILLGFSWLAGGSRTPAAVLEALRSTNPEVRWRAANDLAQILPRDDTLAADPQFGLELSGLLAESLPAMAKPPSAGGDDDSSRRAAAQNRQTFLSRRSEVKYLTGAVGGLIVPVGAPVLAQMAANPVSPDEKTDVLLRRQAVWALAQLGNNSKRFGALPEARRAEVLAELDRLAGQGSEAGRWAAQAAETLRGQGSAGVVTALTKAAASEDPLARKQAALALSFWPGSPAESLLAEQTLLRLTRDDGRGRSPEVTDRD